MKLKTELAIKVAIEAQAPATFSLESIRDFVSDKALDFRAAFDAEPGKAKEILARHIDQLILTPRGTEDGMVYVVSGDIDLSAVMGRL
jgi:hypothetical protein